MTAPALMKSCEKVNRDVNIREARQTAIEFIMEDYGLDETCEFELKCQPRGKGSGNWGFCGGIGSCGLVQPSSTPKGGFRLSRARCERWRSDLLRGIPTIRPLTTLKIDLWRMRQSGSA